MAMQVNSDEFWQALRGDALPNNCLRESFDRTVLNDYWRPRLAPGNLEIEVLTFEENGNVRTNGGGWNFRTIHTPDDLFTALAGDAARRTNSGVEFFIVPLFPSEVQSAIGALRAFVTALPEGIGGEESELRTLLTEHLGVAPHSRPSSCTLAAGRPSLFRTSIPCLEGIGIGWDAGRTCTVPLFPTDVVHIGSVRPLSAGSLAPGQPRSREPGRALGEFAATFTHRQCRLIKESDDKTATHLTRVFSFEGVSMVYHFNGEHRRLTGIAFWDGPPYLRDGPPYPPNHQNIHAHFTDGRLGCGNFHIQRIIAAFVGSQSPHRIDFDLFPLYVQVQFADMTLKRLRAILTEIHATIDQIEDQISFGGRLDIARIAANRRLYGHIRTSLHRVRTIVDTSHGSLTGYEGYGFFSLIRETEKQSPELIRQHGGLPNPKLDAQRQELNDQLLMLRDQHQKLNGQRLELLKQLEAAKNDISEVILRHNDMYQALISTASITASELSIAEARSVTRLSQLAFIFIPITFIAGIFGMNPPEMGQVPLYVPFVIIVASVIITVFYLPDIRGSEIDRTPRRLPVA